ncbi:aldehyde ferredoxin oxidoreductase [Pseudodesulfovibrio cashew]|uniref:Aldehyde ferredoxin oxidoreductase n=1 Tax=Pseudodesulfovibrio cashew TaxID=2678688 RepID=A0A6I6JGX7_9BACT|nr:aldehyde ferredoxin oxidoreductase C-terminal domain-containing protein [Pseudodesulfovibrio cashew]QGY40278.1 aldehyde ferredoxin oxidoreductase [Pseudodesulfovibrio cashew]
METMIRINMTQLTASSDPVDARYAALGGRGLNAAILTDEVPPTCDPLGPSNKLIFSSGILGGTTAPCSGRLSIGAKSPLTGTIKESNAGGTFAQKLMATGVKALVVEGKAENDAWYVAVITDGEAQLIDASKYRGMNNYQLSDALRADFGEDIGSASIGCAGERGYAASSIQVADMEGHPSRAAGRGGLGAVMGSKGLKAIVIKPGARQQTEYVDKKTFLENSRQYVKALKEHPFTGQGLPALGTPMLVEAMNGMGVLPTRNYKAGSFEHSSAISGEKIAELQGPRGGVMTHKCHSGCIIQCSQIYNDASGEYLTSGFEYETIGLVGANCGLDDIDVVASIDRACDDLGVDTMDTGCALAVAMEAGKAEFGNCNDALALVGEMVEGTPFGRILGNGAAATGKELGVTRVPVVKGQSMAAYDPRALKGTGITYATSPMGADHTAGNTVSCPGDPADKAGKIEDSRNCQIGFTLLDCLGLCLFAGVVMEDPANIQLLANMVGAKIGGEWDIDRLMGIAVNTLSLERRFNLEAGFTEKDDRLPDYFYTEPLEQTGHVFDLADEELRQVLTM